MPHHWTRHFFYRRESLRTTWIFRLALTAALLLIIGLFVIYRVPRIGETLVCENQLQPSEALLLENFDSSYLVFERARELYVAGAASRVFVPVPEGANPGEPNMVSAGIADVMVRAARLPEAPQLVPIQEVEPISLNAAYQIRTVLQKEQVRSVIVVAPAFRSARSSLIYSRVFGAVGIATSCAPVFGRTTPNNWTTTWHGVQEVAEQYGKLQYYRFWVLPRLKNETD